MKNKTHPLVGTEYESYARLLRSQGKNLKEIGNKLQLMGFKSDVSERQMRNILTSYFNLYPLDVDLDVDVDNIPKGKLSGLENLEELITRLYAKINQLEDERKDADDNIKLKIDRTISDISAKIKNIRNLMLNMYRDAEISKLNTMILRDINKIVFRLLDEVVQDDDKKLKFVEKFKEAYIKLKEKYDLK